MGFPRATRLVVCFQVEGDAKRFRNELDGRLAKFGLEVAEDKTKVLAFGPLAESRARARGEKPQTFDFLGLTHYCSRSQSGSIFRMKRVTARKKFKAKLREFKEWLKANRTMPLKELMKIVSAKLRGHFAYYGVSDNARKIGRFAAEVRTLLYRWLNRRSNRGRMSWEKFCKLLKKFPLPRPRIKVNLLPTW